MLLHSVLIGVNIWNWVGSMSEWLGQVFLMFSLTLHPCLTGDHSVGKRSAVGQPTRPTQLSIPEETIILQAGAVFGCMVSVNSPCVQAWAVAQAECWLLSVMHSAAAETY